MIDFLIGLLGSYLYKQLPDYGGAIVKSNYLTNRMNDKEIVILGSSRASHHYKPKVMTECLNINESEYDIYNGGIDGHYLEYNCCFIQCILSRYTPDIIIFDTEDIFLYKSSSSKELCSLYPFYHNNECVHSFLDRLSTKEKIKISFNQYIYNDKLLRLIQGISESGGYNDGYYPLYRVMKSTEKKIDNNIPETDEELVELFKNTLQLCKDNNVNLIISSSPRYKSRKNTVTDSICRAYNIPYIDLSYIFNDKPEYFQDAGHLNDDGATIYTQIFSERLNSVLDKALSAMQ